MIDIKVGEEHKKTQTTNTQVNQDIDYTEENILVQIRHLRDKISEYEEIRHKQRYYTNLMLTLIFIMLFISVLPTIFKFIAILGGANAFF